MTCATVFVGVIVQGIAAEVGVLDIDTSAIDTIEARGFLAAGGYNSANTMRALQRAYFFDIVEIDGQLVAVLRGGASVATIMRDDMVRGQEADFETAREQGVEFPKKLHLAYASAESDYTPTNETSERRSPDIKSVSEITIEVPINLTSDDAAQIADKLHKIAWAELEGTAKFGVSEKFAKLIPSDPITVETSTGVLKRARIQKIVAVDGVIQIDAVVDRISAYASAVVAPDVVVPDTPTTNLPGDTTYEIMDLPVLDQGQDTLHIYIAAHGASSAWTGAVIEQLVDTEWLERGRITFPSSIGALLEALPDHPAGLDTTNDVLVSLSDTDIATITQAEFDAGGNAALIDNEIINFRDVTQEGDDYRISYLTRGGLNTTTEAHSISDRFVKLVAPERIQVDASYLDTSVTYRVYSFGTVPGVPDETTFTFDGNSQIEFPPLNATQELLTADWLFEWDHNKRIGAPNSPVTSIHFIDFGLRLIKGGTTVLLNTIDETLTYTEAEQISNFGAAVTSFDTVELFGINEFTGEGDIATPADITGFKYKLESGGYYMLTGHSGALGLE